MSYPATLPSSSTHEAMNDALLRAVLAIDTNDIDLFKSAISDPDTAVFEMNGNATTGLDAIINGMFNTVGPLDTTHFLTNTRIVAENNNTAIITCSALAQHYRTGEGLQPETDRLLSGSLYRVDIVKDGEDGLWKIKKWSMKLVWVEGDRSIVTPK